MLHVKEMGRGFVEKPEDVVKVGDDLQVQIVGVDRRRGRIDLSIKDLLPPPEVTPVAVAAAAAEDHGSEPQAISDDIFASPFELAFQEAQAGSNDGRRERRKKARPWEYEEYDEDDIIHRTIAHHRKSKGI
jgi:predicted RNA-binding protein with RPS1 domain